MVSTANSGWESLESIEKRIERVIGIANNKEMDTKDYVLGKFMEEEIKILQDDYKKLVNVIDDFCDLSLDRLMGKYNNK